MINLGMIGFGNFGRQLAKGFHDTGFCRLKFGLIDRILSSRHDVVALSGKQA